jgi:nucleotide-binding universal stress UspA family protein
MSADRTVVVAYDGSPAARHALTDAVTILGPCTILVLTVWEAGMAYQTAPAPPDGMMLSPVVAPEVAHDVDSALHGQADRIAAEGAELARSLGFVAEPMASADAGDVPGTILDVARDRNAAAIIVGSRGLSGLRARLEGSTSKGLLHHATCPVIVVHQPHEH